MPAEPLDIETAATTESPSDNEQRSAEAAASGNRMPASNPPAGQQKTGRADITFKVQILTASRPPAKNDRRLKGLKGVEYYKEKGIYKYTCGASADYNQVLRTRRSLLPRFKDAFIIAFRNGEKMNVQEAIKEFKKRRNK